ncbi:MAG: DUF4364 family protein [Butyrivibrio sp.]|nr:DUF4364 family protein [Muribaculum sp.]MCM1551210.1 DUF4364 family protein [Butyrivibrio sp.]
MLQEPLTFNKLIILYMLSRVSFPLTRTQIGDFLLDRDYANFLPLQQAIGELDEAGMIRSQANGNRTLLTITAEGEQTLRYLGSRINASIKREIDTYFKEQGHTLRNEIAVQSNYYKSTSGEYEAHLIAMDRDIKLVDITLSVPTKESAAAICDNWTAKNETIYQFLIQELF